MFIPLCYILTVQETWFTDMTDKTQYGILNYNLISVKSKSLKHDDLVIYVHSSFTYLKRFLTPITFMSKKNSNTKQLFFDRSSIIILSI